MKNKFKRLKAAGPREKMKLAKRAVKINLRGQNEQQDLRKGSRDGKRKGSRDEKRKQRTKQEFLTQKGHCERQMKVVSSEKSLVTWVNWIQGSFIFCSMAGNELKTLGDNQDLSKHA